ncbi:MAG: 4-alpha-glucanotransferase [Fibrobacteria bacterium]|nr:4-alpha-glucanotransferase [Fibrobacteria bacterium]
MMNRKSGILLHISSLPSRFGIGDLGPEAYAFADFLHSAGQKYWQVLPLNPTDCMSGNSPYSSISAFAGNSLFISPELMVKNGYLDKEKLQTKPLFKQGSINYDRVKAYKDVLLKEAYQQFKLGGKSSVFENFCVENSSWLDNYALFSAIKNYMKYTAWSEWPEDIKNRDETALSTIKENLTKDILFEKFIQFLFYEQWKNLKEYCNSLDIEIIGDMPIYVNHDSADVWCNPHIFKLNEDKRPAYVAGVPPDLFSTTGQRWGNPVYNWDTLKSTGYAWWRERIAHDLNNFDSVRIDHFRGLLAYWEIPAGNKTAQHGQWVNVDFESFFNALQSEENPLPIIAEDLGIITDDVKEAMARHLLPGMKVLLFAFDEEDPKNPYLPHNYPENCVVYTGTHDNNTTRGWFENEASKEAKLRVNTYLKQDCNEANVHIRLTKLAMGSKAQLAIIPIQDIIGLDSSARMNIPGQAKGNWEWRLKKEAITYEAAEWLKELSNETNRNK